MSLPPQVNIDKSGKHRGAAMKEPVQHSGEVYYGMGPPALEATHSDSASSSGVYNPEKAPQSLPHYQQATPVKWVHQESIQAPSWSQEAPASAWGQNFSPYMSGVNARGQMAYHKGVHEGATLSIGGENQLPAAVEPYRDASQTQAQGRGLNWEQQTVAAMHQAQLQAYQHVHKGVDLQGQPHVSSHSLQGSMLQPFQTTFRPNKQFSTGYYSVFPGNKGARNLLYNEPPKSQLLHQMQQQQMHHHQQQQQQHLHQQHQLQLQQHQIQQQQMQQQYHQQQLQERQQHMQQMQQLQQQNVPQQDVTHLQVQPKLQQTQSFGNYQPPEPVPPVTIPIKKDVQSLEAPQELEAQICDASSVSSPCSEKLPLNPAEHSDASLAAPRRSRRLSREGQSPLGLPSINIWSQESKEPPPSQNGGESQATTGGVIQITSRRRRASKEINLETLAQQASKMEPAKMVKVNKY